MQKPRATGRALALSTACILFSALCIGLRAAPSPQPAPIDVVLERMFGYVERFQREFGSLVAEERYEQVVRQSGLTRGETRRVLRSDFLLVNVPGQGWLPFRDVFEADGRQVRDRQDRLTSLFLGGATTDALAQARRIMDEGARYNLGNGTRNINIPTLAFMYLAPDVRGRVRFTDASPRGDDARRTIDFSEVGRPALIATTGGRDLPARGRLWVDEATGTITRTELHADDTGVEARVDVTFRYEPVLGTWVPQRMEDRFKRRGDAGEVRGAATYSRFRRFQVSTTEELATPDSEGKP